MTTGSLRMSLSSKRAAWDSLTLMLPEPRVLGSKSLNVTLTTRRPVARYAPRTVSDWPMKPSRSVALEVSMSTPQVGPHPTCPMELPAVQLRFDSATAATPQHPPIGLPSIRQVAPMHETD